MSKEVSWEEVREALLRLGQWALWIGLSMFFFDQWSTSHKNFDLFFAILNIMNAADVQERRPKNENS